MSTLKDCSKDRDGGHAEVQLMKTIRISNQDCLYFGVQNLTEFSRP